MVIYFVQKLSSYNKGVIFLYYEITCNILLLKIKIDNAIIFLYFTASV